MFDHLSSNVSTAPHPFLNVGPVYTIAATKKTLFFLKKYFTKKFCFKDYSIKFMEKEVQQ